MQPEDAHGVSFPDQIPCRTRKVQTALPHRATVGVGLHTTHQPETRQRGLQPQQRGIPEGRTMTFFHSHVHGMFSPLDGMGSVPELVAKVARMGQPAMALTDHGNGSGWIQLYKAARKHDILPFPGVEAYLVPDGTENKDAKRFHIGLLALNFKGYQALAKFISKTHTREKFHRFPRADLTDLAELSREASNDIAVTTGCYFGWVQQTLITKGEQAALGIIKTYARLFPNTYVELQKHNIEHDDGWTDDAIVETLMYLAMKAGLPTIITQDSHYPNIRQQDAHALMKRMVYGGEDPEFPGDSFHLATERFVKGYYTPLEWRQGMAGLQDLLDRNEVVLPALEKFKYHVPKMSNRPVTELRRAVKRALKKLGLVSPKYADRAEHELDIIEDLNVADYILLVRTITDWCHEHGVFVEVRGSANSSLVCYALGITTVDPLKWNLLFERFLSRDRLKPPDIDLDVDDSARERLVRYISTHLQVSQVGTYSKLGMNEEGKGSVVVTYATGLRRQAGKDPKKLAEAGMIKTMEDVRRFRAKDYKSLKKLAGIDVRKSYGVHAAALLLSAGTQTIEEYVPTMLVASSNTTVTQFIGDDLDELGFLKIDFLGQSTLRKMRLVLEAIGKPTTGGHVWDWIPFDDPDTMRTLREGRTDTGIFHFEGYTKAKGGRDMRMRTTKDVIMAQALFMPGSMTSGATQTFLRRRFNKEAREDVTYPHPVFERVLKETHGVVVFQEQVINIMRGLGMSIEGINTFFKAVKDSGVGSGDRNRERFESVRQEFAALCTKNGIADEDVDDAWQAIEGFVSYGFNRAHATGYGLRSYRDAYLKTHFPLEWMWALLVVSVGDDKEPNYIREARRMKIRLLPPNVNISGATWTIDQKRRGILKGLSSIKGIGTGAAQELAANAPYKDIDDLIERTDSRAVTGGKAYLADGRIKTLNGVLLKLKEAGALASINIE